MDQLRSSSSLNSLPVIPPITNVDKDNGFLSDLNKWMTDELSKVDQENPELCYYVYKEAFDKIIDHLGVYKPLLNRIKAEYEGCINTIRDGQHEAFFLTGKLNEIVNAPIALQNYKKRTEDLENKISFIETDNERLCKELDELRSQRVAKEVKELNRLAAESSRKGTEEQGKLKNKGPVPGLTIDQATDSNLLQRELEKLEREFRELSLSYHTRYSSRTLENGLKEHLATGVISRDQLSDEIGLLKQKQLKLSVAVQAAQAYLKIQPPHETIGQAVVAALAREANNLDSDTNNDANRRVSPTSTTLEEEDVSRENQTEVLIEYIEKFNELLENKMYREAAVHAANSIKGILRTSETMQRFKDLSVGHGLSYSPLLTFCEALMSTVPSFSVRPNEVMSEECVSCALQEKRLDLLTHWLSQDRLVVSEKMADMIFNFCISSTRPRASTCLALAQKIYMDVMSHVSAMVCMVRQGRIKQALDYAERKGCLSDSMIQVLSRCPDLQLANALYGLTDNSNHTAKPLLPLGVIVTVLFEAGSLTDGLSFLENIYVHERQDFGADALKGAVANDPITTQEQWMSLVERLRQSNAVDLAKHLLTAVLVKTSVRKASKTLEGFKETEIASVRLTADKESLA